MAHTTMNSAIASAPLAARLAGFSESLKASWAQYTEYKRTYNELASLSDRDLADINIRRCDLRDIARAHVYGA